MKGLGHHSCANVCECQRKFGSGEGIHAKGERAQGTQGDRTQTKYVRSPRVHIFISVSERKVALGSYPALPPSCLGCEDWMLAGSRPPVVSCRVQTDLKVNPLSNLSKMWWGFPGTAAPLIVALQPSCCIFRLLSISKKYHYLLRENRLEAWGLEWGEI